MLGPSCLSFFFLPECVISHWFVDKLVPSMGPWLASL